MKALSGSVNGYIKNELGLPTMTLLKCRKTIYSNPHADWKIVEISLQFRLEVWSCLSANHHEQDGAAGSTIGLFTIKK
jgi:hypothetical protein